MQTWLTLLRREWWEHRSGFLWTPLATAALVILASALALTLVSGADTHLSYRVEQQAGPESSSDVFEWKGNLLNLLDFNSWSEFVFERRAAQFRALIASPFVLGHFLVAVFVLLGGMHDERRDRSVLFWKSMPVSDLQTVASKLVFAVWVAPLVAIASILTAQVGSLLLLTVLGPSAGVSGIGQAWQHAGLLSGGVLLLSGYLVQGLWALPVYAWLLLVSAAAPRVPFVWALLLPAALVALEGLLMRTTVLSGQIQAHLSFRALPRPESVNNGAAQPAVGFAEQLALLGSSDLWLGVVVAAVLLTAAVHFRGRNNDL
jgi:ABC-2 type transport system permease protein